MQIRNMFENPPSKEMDNWLIAKKPINNYVCASCESYLGDLKNKSVYLPWNKVPSREEKKYRMGHGFSRMLQLVNMDLLKNAEKITAGDVQLRGDNKKTISPKGRRLPKINSQPNIHSSINTANAGYPRSNHKGIEIGEQEQLVENSGNNSNFNNFASINGSQTALINGVENNISTDGGRHGEIEIGLKEDSDGVKDDKKEITKDENSPKVIRVVKKIKK